MLNPKEWNKDYDGLAAIKKFDFDIDDMNENIRDYRPYVSKIEFWNGYASVLVEDKNQMMPPFWMDYGIDSYGDPSGDWNQYIFHLDDASDMEKKIYQDDPEVFEKVDSTIFDYLLANGYMKDLYPDWNGYAWTEKADMESGDILYKKYKPQTASKNAKSEDKYAQRRARFGFGKKKDKKPVLSMNRKDDKRTPFEQASSHKYPDCPRCNSSMIAIDMKFNGKDDDGNYYEFYDCPSCGHNFTITYDGPDDSYDWWYDE